MPGSRTEAVEQRVRTCASERLLQVHGIAEVGVTVALAVTSQTIQKRTVVLMGRRSAQSGETASKKLEFMCLQQLGKKRSRAAARKEVSRKQRSIETGL